MKEENTQNTLIHSVTRRRDELECKSGFFLPGKKQENTTPLN